MPVHHFAALLKDSRRFKKHILVCIGVAIVLCLISFLFFDQSLSWWLFQPAQKDVIWKPAREVTNIALSDWYFYICIGAWAFAAFIAPRIGKLKPYVSRIDYIRRWGLNFLVGLIICGALTHILKFTVGRQRPHKSPDFHADVFNHFTTHWHWHSFSSGHAQVIFTAAVFFSLLLPRFAWFFGLFAVISAATRVIIHDHFLSDIIAGAFVGYIGSLLAILLMQSKTKNGLYGERP